MLYIIGGASRSGKSIISRRLLAEKQVPYFPLDVLVSSVKQIESLNVISGINFIHKATQLWKNKITKNMFEHLGLFEKDYTVEGETILPLQIDEFQKEFPGIEIKVCFIGYPDLTPTQKLGFIRAYNTNLDDWTVKHDDEKMLGYINEMIEYSKYLKDECEKYNLPFFDVSKDFEGIHEEIFNFLIN